jgi:hypothetical protein
VTVAVGFLSFTIFCFSGTTLSVFF